LTDNFIRQFLKHRGFSTDIQKAVDEKTAKLSEAEEMKHRLLAEAMTKQFVNEMMPMFRKKMEQDQTKKTEEKPVRKIIIPGE
jgi:UDP-galactopyranose mutase